MGSINERRRKARNARAYYQRHKHTIRQQDKWRRRNDRQYREAKVESSRRHYERNKEKRRAYAREYSRLNRRLRTPELRAVERAWRIANRDRVLRYNRTYRHKNLEKVHQWAKASRQRNKRKRNISLKQKALALRSRRQWAKLHGRQYQMEERARLSDTYVKSLFRPLRASDLPPELVELKRLHVQLLREKKKQYGTKKDPK